MTADILSLLKGIRAGHSGNFMARCPAHDDSSPSLSVKLCDDGRTLIHCFAGCQVEDIVGAVGLQLSDLMPDRPLDHCVGRVRTHMPARDGLLAVAHESLVVGFIAADLLQQRAIDDKTWTRLATAISRIQRVSDACGVQP